MVGRAIFGKANPDPGRELTGEEIHELNAFGSRVSAALGRAWPRDAAGCAHAASGAQARELPDDTVTKLNDFGRRLAKVFEAA